jgi:hypothetical protein
MLNDFLLRLSGTVKRLAYRTPFASLRAPSYPYLFTPAQLTFMCQQLEQVSAIGGPIGEVGCFRGQTTIFLNKLLDTLAYAAPYYAFDTFEGFTRADVEFEGAVRGKDRLALTRGFNANHQSRFDETMRRNGCRRVQSRKIDANVHEFRELEGCAFCLIDVDLYRPVLRSLQTIYARCAPGAVIVVDDCGPAGHNFDGAAQAYHEFMRSLGRPSRIVHDKLGVVEVSAPQGA